ncbi:MAG: VTT domain-containing protein, partial [Legionellales bacterium]|nr:VTT domain-containing protein [Legionellales bacterium]
LGGILGDLFSFMIGRIYKDTIHSKWPFYYFPKIIKKGENFFIDHGKKSVFTARFVGPVRPVVPLIAGTMNMKLRPFLLTDIASGIIWAPAYMLPGAFIAFTGSTFRFDTKIVLYYGFIIIVVLLFSFWLYKLFIHKIIHRIDNLILSLWKKQKPHKISLMKFNLPIVRDSSKTPDLLIWGFIMLGLYIFICHEVLTNGILTHWNNNVLVACQRADIEKWKEYIVMYTLIAEPIVMVSLYSTILLYFIISKNINFSILWFINGAIAGGGTYIMKYIFNIARPPGIALRETTSFPSSHTTLIIAILGYLYFVLSPKKMAKPNFIIFGILVLTMATSRILLSAHWLTDILGGLTWGFSCLFINAALVQGIHLSKKDKKNIIVISIVTLFIVWVSQIIFNFDNHFEGYKLDKSVYN